MVSYFNPSLIFVGKAGAYPKSGAFPAIIKLG